MRLMGQIFRILVNEVRKREIALGHYCQLGLTLEESKGNVFGAIDLREKSKLHHEQALQLQQIEKKMDATRRQIYRVYLQNNRYQQWLTLQTDSKLEREFDLLNPPLNSCEEINILLQKSVIFAFYYSIVLGRPEVRKELSEQLVSLTGQSELYLYGFSLSSGSWERWQQIDLNLTEESCNADPLSRALSARQIIRLHGISFKLQGLRSYAEDMSHIVDEKERIINLKGAEIYFAKLLLLYGQHFSVQLTK